MLDPKKITLYLDAHSSGLCPVCKGLITRDNAKLAFILTPTEDNLKRFKDKLICDANAVVVDSINCQLKFILKTKAIERKEMEVRLLNV